MGKLLLLTTLLFACNGDDGEPITPAQTPCEKLREHLIDMRLAEASPKVDKEAHRLAMRGAFGDSFFASCSRMSDENRASRARWLATRKRGSNDEDSPELSSCMFAWNCRAHRHDAGVDVAPGALITR